MNFHNQQGFAISQLTSYCDIFIQDFLPSANENGDDTTFNAGIGSYQLELDDLSKDYLSTVTPFLISQPDPKLTKSNSKTCGKCLSKSCDIKGDTCCCINQEENVTSLSLSCPTDTENLSEDFDNEDNLLKTFRLASGERGAIEGLAHDSIKIVMAEEDISEQEGWSERSASMWKIWKSQDHE